MRDSTSCHTPALPGLWTFQVCSPIGGRGPQAHMRAARSVSESLERLGMEYIDIIQVHDVEYADDLQLARARFTITAS